MTFFDKFFTIRNRNSKAENEFKLAIEPLRSSVFEIAKEEIRVVLFRECDRRGRRLLFDSNAVERLPLNSHVKSKDFLCSRNLDHLQNGKFFDFVEVSNSHGYKYKKPSSDVTLLGEMIFGSVAMVFKSGNTCKIHSLTSPKGIMFTNIVYAPGQCRYQLSSDPCIESNMRSCSGVSLDESRGDRTSSSDSKLYEQKESSGCSTSTYPCFKHKSNLKKHCCQYDSCANSSCKNKTNLNETLHEDCLDNCSVNTRIKTSCEKCSLLHKNRGCNKVVESEKESSTDYSQLSLDSPLKREHGECKCVTGDGCCPLNNLYDCNKDMVSSCNGFSSSLASLRRRCKQSWSSLVDETCYEETVRLKNKTRTKLGMGLVVGLTNSLADDLEKFLFNHTIIIENILMKLQSSVETAYIKKENFVDLTYNAFINCQQSMYELITGGKYARPIWLTLTGTSLEDTVIQNEVYSQFHENIKDYKKQDTPNNVKLKFLHEFCDVLVKFDTKDTNFFISTLLTAVLTHHLSWATGIAESDNLEHKSITGLRSYNPIWAQLNDLNGMLGSPLKSAKTVVVGPENNRNSIASVIQILTYFIRCYNVMENVYDFDFEELTKVSQAPEDHSGNKVEDLKNLNFVVNDTCSYASQVVKTKINSDEQEFKISRTPSLNELSEKGVIQQKEILENHRVYDKIQRKCPSDGMKRSKSLFRLGEENSSKKHAKLYPSIDDLARLEGINLNPYLDQNLEEVKNLEYVDDCREKIPKLIRVPGKPVICSLEKNLILDEGFDVIDTSATVFDSGMVASEFSNDEKTEIDVRFVLGDNDQLINLKKLKITNPLKTDIETEESVNISVGCKNMNLCRSESVSNTISSTQDNKLEGYRTFCSEFKGTEDRTLSRNSAVLQKHSHGQTKIEDEQNVISTFCEMPMPRIPENQYAKKRLDISSVLGGVNDHYNSEQIIQGVLGNRSQWEKIVRRDLTLYKNNHVLDRDVTEALCIIGDMNSWEVSLLSNRKFAMDQNNFSGISIGMSQLVADMLESLLHICRIKLNPDFCFSHIEKKLHEIYTKSKSVAELLESTDMCSIEYLTSRLDITVNDVPLLLSVATTHSPHISSKYGLTYS